MMVDRSRRTCQKIVDEIFDAHDTKDYTLTKTAVLSGIRGYIISTYLYTGIFVCIRNKIKLQSVNVGCHS